MAANARTDMQSKNLFNYIFIISILGLQLSRANPFLKRQTGNADVITKLSEISNKVDAIDAKVDILTGRSSAQGLLVRIDNKLDSLDGKLTTLIQQNGQPQHNITSAGEIPPAEVTAGPDTAPLPNCVDLISIAVDPLPSGGTAYFLRYRKNEDVIRFRVYDNMGPARHVNDTRPSRDGLWTLSFEVQNTSITELSPWLVIFDGDDDHMLALRLNNSLTEPTAQMFPDMPTIQVVTSQTSYQPDQDIHVQVSVSKKGATLENSSIRAMFTGVDLETGKFQNVYTEDDMFNGTMPVFYDDHFEVNLTIFTSVHRLSGHYQISMDVDDTGGPALSFLQIARHVLVRPAGQSGPLPAGYLGMIEHPYHQKSQDGNLLSSCVVGNECPMNCVAVGETISSIDVFVIHSDGTMSPVPGAQTVDDRESKIVYWKFSAERTSGDRDGITRFQCVARDLTHGKTVTQLLDAQAVIMPAIDEATSSILVENDVDNPGNKLILVSCNVTGRPFINVTFDLPGYEYSQAPDRVVPETHSNSVAYKIFSLTDREYENLKEEVRTGRTPGPSCELWSPYDGIVKHTFSFPR